MIQTCGLIVVNNLTVVSAVYCPWDKGLRDVKMCVDCKHYNGYRDAAMMKCGFLEQHRRKRISDWFKIYNDED